MRAVASACCWAACAAFAQQADTVVLYGRVHAHAESVEGTGGEAPIGRHARITNQASMFGIRALERVAGDLSAWFQIEIGFPLDAAAPPFVNRNSAIGVRGAWGTLLAGRWDSPFEQTQAGIVDPFVDQGLPDITAATLHQGNFARRPANAVQYWSAPWRGLQAKLGYAAGEARAGAANPYDYSVSVAYSGERSYLALAYEAHNDQVGGAVAAAHDEKGYGIAAFHRIGTLKLEGQVGAYARSGAETQRSYALGFEWPTASLPHATILGIYQRAWRGGAPMAAAKPRCEVWGFGVRYGLSARTFLVAELARVQNRRGNSCNFGSNPIEIADGQDIRGFGAGLRTVF
jgi:predicted porin